MRSSSPSRQARLTLVLLLFVTGGCLAGNERPSDLHVAGGEDVASGDPVAGATVALLDAAGQVFCTATLVGQSQAITAAHCFAQDPNALRAIGAGVDLKPLPLSDLRVVPHPRFSMSAVDTGGNGGPIYDIAAVTFAGSLPPGLTPSAIASPSAITAGASVTVAGYGSTGSDRKDFGKLRKVTMPVAGIFAERREFGTSTPGKESCFGDSGGPVYLTAAAGGGLRLAGSVSRGAEPCSVGSDIYTDVTRYGGWLKCAFETLGRPLAGLIADESARECDQSGSAAQGASGGVATPPGGGGGRCPPGQHEVTEPDGSLACVVLGSPDLSGAGQAGQMGGCGPGEAQVTEPDGSRACLRLPDHGLSGRP